MKVHPERLAVTSLLLILALSACSRHGAGAGAKGGADEEPPSMGGSTHVGRHVVAGVDLGPNKSFAKVSYRPEVKTVADSGFTSTLVAMSPDGHVLVFHNAPADIRALKGGDVMLIKNQLARKVLGSGDDGEETYAEGNGAVSAGDSALGGEGKTMTNEVVSNTASETAEKTASRLNSSGKLGILSSSLLDSAVNVFQRHASNLTQSATSSATTAISSKSGQGHSVDRVMLEQTTVYSNFSTEKAPAAAFDVPSGYTKVDWQGPMTGK